MNKISNFEIKKIFFEKIHYLILTCFVFLLCCSFAYGVQNNNVEHALVLS